MLTHHLHRCTLKDKDTTQHVVYSIEFPTYDAPATANNDVPCAACWDIPSLDVMSGIMTKPPPIPARDPKVPASEPMKNALGNSFFAATDFIFVVSEEGFGFDLLWFHRLDFVRKRSFRVHRK